MRASTGVCTIEQQALPGATTIRMVLVTCVACSLCLPYRYVKGLVRYLRDFNMHKQLLVSDCTCSLVARAHS